MSDERLRYRVLTGPDDRTFCERVTAALAEGYRLHGGPALTHDGQRVVVAQALVLDDADTGVATTTGVATNAATATVADTQAAGVRPAREHRE